MSNAPDVTQYDAGLTSVAIALIMTAATVVALENVARVYQKRTINDESLASNVEDAEKINYWYWWPWSYAYEGETPLKYEAWGFWNFPKKIAMFFWRPMNSALIANGFGDVSPEVVEKAQRVWCRPLAIGVSAYAGCITGIIAPCIAAVVVFEKIGDAIPRGQPRTLTAEEAATREVSRAKSKHKRQQIAPHTKQD